MAACVDLYCFLAFLSWLFLRASTGLVRLFMRWDDCFWLWSCELLRVFALLAALLTLCMRALGFAELLTLTSLCALTFGAASCLPLLGAIAKLLLTFALLPCEFVTYAFASRWLRVFLLLMFWADVFSLSLVSFELERLYFYELLIRWLDKFLLFLPDSPELVDFPKFDLFGIIANWRLDGPDSELGGGLLFLVARVFFPVTDVPDLYCSTILLISV